MKIPPEVAILCPIKLQNTNNSWKMPSHLLKCPNMTPERIIVASGKAKLEYPTPSSLASSENYNIGF